MGILTTFALFLHFFIDFPFTEPHVLTAFDGETLEKYFFQLQNKTSAEDWSTEETFSHSILFLYCHDLRQSRIFQYKENEMWVRESSEIDHVISKDLLEREKNHTIEIGMRKKHILKIGNKNITNLSSFNCMDHYGEFNWYVTTGLVPNSAFLFTLKPNFFNIVSRETHGKEKKGEIIPNFAAIIDEPAHIISQSQSNMSITDLLINSIKLSSTNDEQFNGEEKLCKIPEILQLRLCSIAADAILDNRFSIDRILTNDSFISTQIYRIRSSYSLRVLNITENACLFVDSRFITGTSISHDFFVCASKTENSGNIFFLSLNLLNVEEAFVVHIRDLDDIEGSFLGILRMPLLLNLEKYIEIFND